MVSGVMRGCDLLELSLGGQGKAVSLRQSASMLFWNQLALCVRCVLTQTEHTQHCGAKLRRKTPREP